MRNAQLIRLGLTCLLPWLQLATAIGFSQAAVVTGFWAFWTLAAGAAVCTVTNFWMAVDVLFKPQREHVQLADRMSMAWQVVSAAESRREEQPE